MVTAINISVAKPDSEVRSSGMVLYWYSPAYVAFFRLDLRIRIGYCYIRIAGIIPTKSLALGAGNMNESSSISKVGRVNKVVCAC
jgi:hypothetical protein